MTIFSDDLGERVATRQEARTGGMVFSGVLEAGEPFPELFRFVEEIPPKR